MPTLKQFRYFDALARLGHFGRAAERCAVTQPALSMQILELEAELGLTLLERRRSGAVLTAAGREVAARAARILAEVRELEDFARARQAGPRGALQLGVIPSVAPYVLPELLPMLRRDFPDTVLQIRETQTRPLTTELLEGNLDVLLVALPLAHREIETLAVCDDRFVLAMPAARRFGSRPRVTADLLADDRLLLLEEGHCLRDQALSFCTLRQIETVDTFGASSLSTLVQMVAHGLGLTLLPEIAIGVETRAAAIRVMRFDSPEPSRQLGLAFRTTSPRKAEFARLAELLQAVQRTRLTEAESVLKRKPDGLERVKGIEPSS